MIKPIFFWSDILVYFLVAVLLCAIGYNWHNENIRQRWYKICTHKTYMISLIIIVCYGLIGFLDSMHFVIEIENTQKVMSVLDFILKPISITTEVSYSAPFATKLFVPTMIKDGANNIVWVADPLQHVKNVSIIKCFWNAFIYASLIMLVSFLILCSFRKKLQLSIKNSNFIIIFSFVCFLVYFSCSVLQLIKYYHILGTDKIGIDVFYSAMKSIRTGLIIGILTTILTLPFAVVFGALAGYCRGLIDDIIQYIYTTLSSIPSVLLIAAAMLSFDALLLRNTNLFKTTEQIADAKLILLCSILGITSWTTLCRILRGEVLKVREQGFIVAAITNGLSSLQIIKKHIIPNLMHIILIAIILDFSGLVLAEAVLSYIGVGVDSTMFSWGNMINSARTELGRDPIIWWSLLGAFITMFVLVLAANIFADGVRNA